MSFEWNDYQGKREEVHPALLPEVDASVSKLELVLEHPLVPKIMNFCVLLAFLFFVSQVGCFFRFRVFNRQEELPFLNKPHVQAYLDAQNGHLSRYAYDRDTEFYNGPIELGMALLQQRKSAVLLPPQFKRVADSRIKVQLDQKAASRHKEFE